MGRHTLFVGENTEDENATIHDKKFKFELRRRYNAGGIPQSRHTI